MSHRKKQFDNTLLTVGIGALLTGATYGLYCYLTSKNQTEACQSYSESNTKTKKKVCSDDMCTICFDRMTNHFSTFSCQHSFHKKCIAQWQAISKTCPICRLPI